jgi:hypothetical protein
VGSNARAFSSVYASSLATVSASRKSRITRYGGINARIAEPAAPSVAEMTIGFHFAAIAQCILAHAREELNLRKARSPIQIKHDLYAVRASGAVPASS